MFRLLARRRRARLPIASPCACETLESRALLAAIAELAPSDYHTDRVLVRLAPSAPSPDVRDPSLAWTPVAGQADLYLAPVGDGQTVAEALAEYRGRDDVMFAQPDHEIRFLEAPNDPLLDLADPTVASGQWTEGWDVRHDASQIIVGVIDTGVDYRHEDLAANIWRNTDEIVGNGRDDDGNGYIDDWVGWDFANDDNAPLDDNGHGTHVAGIIGAVGDNGRGVAGVAWDVQIMPLKFMDRNGSGFVSDAIEALDYARRNGAQIVNNSWSGVRHSAALAEAIARFENSGGIFVAAAGNDGVNLDQAPTYPAATPHANAVTVAAVDGRGDLANFSNFGANTADIAAPGVGVLSTLPNNRYGRMSGTSMAAPQVAGALALIWAEHPDWRAEQVIERLFDTASSDAPKDATAHGTLNLRDALAPTAGNPIASQHQRWVGSDATSLTGVRLQFASKAEADAFRAAWVRVVGPEGVTPWAGVQRVSSQEWFVRFETQTSAGDYRLEELRAPYAADETAWRTISNATIAEPVQGRWSGDLRMRDALGARLGRTIVAFDVRHPRQLAQLGFGFTLQHARPEQVVARLVRPDGRSVELLRDGRPAPGVRRVVRGDHWTLEASPETLSKLTGGSASGRWRLILEDRGSGAQGRLRSFGFDMRSPVRTGRDAILA